MKKIDSLKEKIDIKKLQEKSQRIIAWVKKFAIVILVLGSMVLGFMIGARFHELGKLDGVLGKSLKGSTITISSGECMMDGEMRPVPLVEDELKVTFVDDKVIEGVLRKTREYVSCSLEKSEISTLPLLKDLSTTPTAVPEITVAPIVKKQDTSFKVLEKQTLVMSGTCKSQDGRDLPSFTDEKVAITSVDAVKEDPSSFTLSGIRKSDKVAILCSSKAVQYKIDNGVEIIPEDPSISYVGQLVMLTSKCLPDPRGVNSKNKQKRKVAFYNFSDSLVKISAQIPEVIKKDQKLQQLSGTLMDESSPNYGDLFICNATDYPILVVPYDSEDTELKTKDPKKAPVKTRTEYDEEAKKTPAPRNQQGAAAGQALQGAELGDTANVLSNVDRPAEAAPQAVPTLDETEQLLNQLNEGEGK